MSPLPPTAHAFRRRSQAGTLDELYEQWGKAILQSNYDSAGGNRDRSERSSKLCQPDRRQWAAWKRNRVRARWAKVHYAEGDRSGICRAQPFAGAAGRVERLPDKRTARTPGLQSAAPQWHLGYTPLPAQRFRS